MVWTGPAVDSCKHGDGRGGNAYTNWDTECDILQVEMSVASVAGDLSDGHSSHVHIYMSFTWDFQTTETRDYSPCASNSSVPADICTWNDPLNWIPVFFSVTYNNNEEIIQRDTQFYTDILISQIWIYLFISVSIQLSILVFIHLYFILRLFRSRLCLQSDTDSHPSRSGSLRSAYFQQFPSSVRWSLETVALSAFTEARNHGDKTILSLFSSVG
jgi:hypothetical protein